MLEELLTLFAVQVLHTDLFSGINHVLVIFIDILILVILAVFFLGFCNKKSEIASNSPGLSWLHIASAIYNGSLGLVYLLVGVWIAVEKHSAEKKHKWIVMLFQGFTWLLLSVSVSWKWQKLPYTKVVKFCPIIGFLSALDLCVTAIWLGISDSEVSVKTVLDCLFLPGAILLLFCTFWGSKHTKTEPDGVPYSALQGEDIDDIDEHYHVTGYANAGLLSRLTFWWLNALVIKGEKKVLDEDDVPQLSFADRAKTCFSVFDNESDSLRRRISSHQPSILRILISCHFKSILLSGFLALIRAITVSSGPLFLMAFIYIAEGKTDFFWAYWLSAGLLCVKCIESIAGRQWYFHSRLMGLKVRSSLCAAIYRKQLRLSSSSKMVHTPGDIVNYVTVDAYRIGEFPYWFHQLWTTPLRLCFALFIVYYTMGLATIATIIVTILIVLCNSPLAKYQHKCQTNFMKAQNQRLKTITESLANMKVLKLYAWESYFKDVIQKLRNEEYGWLKGLQLQKGYYVVLFWSAPVFLGAATFMTCYFLGISLNATNSFTFLATLRILQEPIRLLPDVLGVFIEAKVSLDRISTFLESPELQTLPVRQVSSNGTELEYSVFINSPALSWESEGLNPTLEYIYLAIKPCAKVAICGEVGAGKSTLLAAILGELPRVEGTVSFLSHTFCHFNSSNDWL